MKLVEKHLYLMTTKLEGISKIEIAEEGRWDIPDEISYSRLQAVLDALSKCKTVRVERTCRPARCKGSILGGDYYACSNCGHSLVRTWQSLPNYCNHCGAKVVQE